MRSREFTGKTTQEAIDAGLAALGLTIADVHVDVIQEGAKGLFGLFGSKPACVRLTVMEDEKEDDHGLSDLISSITLSEPQSRKPEKKAEAKPEKKAEAKSEKKAEAKPEKKAEAKPEKKAEAKPEKKAEAKPEKRAEAKPEKRAEAKPEKKAEAKSEKKAEPACMQQEGEEAAGQKDTQKRDVARAEKPRTPREKKPREGKQAASDGEREQDGVREADAGLLRARTFVPDGPPVMHDEDTPAGRAQRFLMDVTQRMNVNVAVYVDESQDGLYIHMIGDTLGILIGRRGETLDALQYLTSLQVNKGREGYVRVTLDTENYRARREESLHRLAQRMANRAQKTGRRVVLEPMNPYERRVLHTALQHHPGVTTHSEGEEPNRRVVITLAGQAEHAPHSEPSDQEGKSASRRSRSRRRGRRGGKGEGAKSAMPAQDLLQAADETQAEESVDLLGAEA